MIHKTKQKIPKKNSKSERAPQIEISSSFSLLQHSDYSMNLENELEKWEGSQNDE